jgi:magnesium transporter
MIQAHVFRKGEELRDLPVDQLSEVRREPRTLVWVDVVSPDADELARIGEEFGLHPLEVDACGRHHQRPKIEEYPDSVLLVTYAVEPVEPHRPLRLHEVGVVAGRNFVLTVHGGLPMASEAIAERIATHRALQAAGAGFLLYVVLDTLVDTFFPALDRIAEKMEDLEEAVFAGRGGGIQQEIFGLRKDLVAVRRVAGPMRDAMLVLLRRDLGLFGREGQRYLQDIYDHLIRVVESVEDYQDLAAGALEANLAVVSNRVNEVARTLTAYAAIFAAVTLITGVYGMNFHHIPELSWRFGYAYALGLMVTAAGGLWWYFKRKGWL